MAKQLISAAKNWEGETPPEIDTYIPSLSDNANIEEAFKLFMYGNFENGSEYDTSKSLYHFLTTFKNGIQSNETAINGHAAQSNNVHNLGTAGPANSNGGDVVGTSAQQTLTNKTITTPTISSPRINENVAMNATSTQMNHLVGVTSAIQTQFTNQTSALTSHAVDTTAIHGIADTSKLARIASAPAGRTIFVQNAQPTALAIGDIWFQVAGL
jgi:hypothetical protein